MNLNNVTHALITGASAGIGTEFCFGLANAGVESLTLVARREDRLKKIKKELQKRFKNLDVTIICSDLAEEHSSEKLLAELTSRKLGVDLLINNAGFGSFGLVKNLDSNREQRMINLNIKTLVGLTQGLLPGMLEQRYGGIINVSSMASFQGLPYLSTYAATKAFVTNYSLAISAELKGMGIVVQALCPGPVETEFGEVASFPSKISITNSLSPAEVVRQSLNGLVRNQSLVIPGSANWLLSQLPRFFPRIVCSNIAMRILRRKFEGK